MMRSTASTGREIEVLYPAMEDFAMDIVLGQGPSARTIRMDLPHFTLVGATTRKGLLTKPLLDRFGVAERLEYYGPDRRSWSATRRYSASQSPRRRQGSSRDVAAGRPTSSTGSSSGCATMPRSSATGR